MQSQETLGLEALDIGKSKPRSKRTRKKARARAKPEEGKGALNAQSKEDLDPHVPKDEAWCPPAVPHYQSLSMLPLGSTDYGRDDQFKLSFIPGPCHVATNAYEYQPPQINAHVNDQSAPGHQPATGCTPPNVPTATVLPSRAHASKSKPSFQVPLSAVGFDKSKSTGRPRGQRSSLSVVTYNGLPTFRIDKSHRHTNAHPSNGSTKGRWTGSPPRNLQTSAPHRAKSPHCQAVDPTTATMNVPTYVHSYNKSPMRHLPAPKPTTAYTTLAHTTPSHLPSPQRLLLILDLNGTLLHRSRLLNFSPRPYLEQFLNYAFANHSLFIWSSAMPPTVAGVCEKLFTPFQRQLLIGEWARDTLDLTSAQYNDRVQVYKRLDKIWDSELVQRSHPDFISGARWSQHNTLLIDDSILKASAQPFNHVEVPEFLTDGDETREDEDAVLAQVVRYLEAARKWSNVSWFLRGRRFEVGQGWKRDYTQGEKGSQAEDDGDDNENGGVRLW